MGTSNVLKVLVIARASDFGIEGGSHSTAFTPWTPLDDSMAVFI